MDLGTGFFDSAKYDTVRSAYSPKVKDKITELFSTKEALVLAEVGAGSGKFTETIFESGLNLKELNIVEPDQNAILIHKEKFSQKEKNLIYFNSTSDKTEISDKSIDIIFAAHCFHWFEIEKTRLEFKRILKQNGKTFIVGRFLDEADEFSAEYISLTRWGNRRNGFRSNVEAYSEGIMTNFFGHPVEKKIICTETEYHSFNRLLDEIKIRIDSSGDSTIKNNKRFREEMNAKIKDFYNKNKLQEKPAVPLKYITFYFSDNMI